MNRPIKAQSETPSQTAGPYVHIGLMPERAGLDRGPKAIGQQIFSDGTAGERIKIEGRVIDGTGTPTADILIEVWQADAKGEYATSGSEGWGRVAADLQTGRYEIDTIKPGAVHSNEGKMAPHLNLWLIARGINIGLNTRIYFEDEEIANASDPVLRSITPASRCDTLRARKTTQGYQFDIHLQGDAETVFFDV